MIKILNSKDADVGYASDCPVIQINHCLTVAQVAGMVRELAKTKGTKFVREVVEAELKALEPVAPVYYNQVSGNAKPNGGYTKHSSLDVALTEARRLATLVGGQEVYTCNTDGKILHTTRTKTEVVQCPN